jgi:hypothetical protein
VASAPGIIWGFTRRLANVNTLTVPEPTTATTSLGPQFTTTQLPTADRHLMVGDDVYVLVSAETVRSSSMPSGWTLVTSFTGLFFAGASGNWKAEIWHYGISSTSTWADLNAVVTLGASAYAGSPSSVSATAIGVLVRGTYIDPWSTTTYTPSTSPAGPSVTYSGLSAYSFGWVVGANYSASGQGQPSLNPTTGGSPNGPQNGWTSTSAFGQNTEVGHKILLNEDDTPPAPTFTTVNTNVTYFYAYFSISDTASSASSGWSVGRIKY